MTETNLKTVNIDTVMEKEMAKLSEEPTKKAIKKIFTLKMAGELMAKGIQPIGTEPNHTKPGFVVFIFDATDELEAAMAEIAESRK